MSFSYENPDQLYPPIPNDIPQYTDEYRELLPQPRFEEHTQARTDKDTQSGSVSDSSVEHSSSSSSATVQQPRQVRNQRSRYESRMHLPEASASSYASNMPTAAVPNRVNTPSVVPNMSSATASVPSAPVIASVNAVTTGVLPNPRDKSAPQFFTGRSSEVEDFLNDFEDLCTKHKITSDRAKVKGLIRYCATGVKHFIQVQEEYINADWDGLKKVILCMYDAEGYQPKYTISDVHNFAIAASKVPITRLEDWHKYLRRFDTRAGRLKLDGKLSEEQYNMYLWIGLQSALRDNEVLSEIKRNHPGYDITKFFTKKQISEAMENIFNKNKAVTGIIDPPAFGIHVAKPRRRYYDSDESSDTDIDEEVRE